MASSDEIVLSYQDTLLRKSDLILLNEPNWINDNIIAFWLEYLENERYKIPHNKLPIVCVSPQVVQLIKMSDEQEIALFLSDLQLSIKELLIFPINDCVSELLPGGGHWSLLSYSPSEGFEHYDSLHTSANLEHARVVAKKIAFLIGINVSVQVKVKDCLKQKNSFDCGIYVMCFVDQLLYNYVSTADEKYLPVAVLTVDSARKTVKNIIYQLSQSSKQ